MVRSGFINAGGTMDIEECFVFTPKSLDEAGEGDVCFTRSWENLNTEASVVIGPIPAPAVEGFIGVDDPRAAMNEVIRQHLVLVKGKRCPKSPLVAKSAVLRSCVRYVPPAEGIYIGSGCIIGEDGFAYDWIDGQFKRFPHLGRVIIGNRVEIEANTHVARGSLKDTVIRDGVKIDANCHVAHNTYVGEDTLITAGVILGGSSRIGKRCWIGLGAVIRDGVTIGDDVCVGMGSVVVKDIPSGVTVMGNPARIK